MQELAERWGAKWWRNEGSLKTEGGRCAKVITLIQELAAKPNWNMPLALRFIKEKYCTRAIQPILAGFMHSMTTFRRAMVQATELFWKQQLSILRVDILVLQKYYFVRT